ncbi:tRNA (guanosine(37)-N1)-methyltransferase TrmD [Chengkuizengella axinellae]|uniref:tRNA (guanine-N(1)-)-methyltransferase n=1 Tax=Chengkuizengella axinellae TaxID=3064388 RepID=A0ABT9IVL6_9BACL|nr:tRNA (guanosine(37)-N1)-methyltransferase TrmD [Chengkuizengella sp. 2205SS18-9]MDP5273416.1 tRNA (guanosine(37)-N1)-methyltransferase TrmD [Chengkuizengella sp. 2205SS18-9]
MKIDVLTLFPDMFQGVFKESILGKANEKGLVALNTINFRDYANNKHKTVDDYPYGGGAGMVLKPEPIFSAVENLLEKGDSEYKVVLMCPQGEKFNQKKAEELSRSEHLIFICGHYEGYDERIRKHLVTDEISIGDYILTGGEIPAMAVIDSVVRLLPGVLGNETSAGNDSFSSGLLEYPQYTRPASFRGLDVPDVLMSGHHKNIEKWREKEALRRTLERRPELLEELTLSKEQENYINEIKLKPKKT